MFCLIHKCMPCFNFLSHIYFFQIRRTRYSLVDYQITWTRNRYAGKRRGIILLTCTIFGCNSSSLTLIPKKKQKKRLRFITSACIGEMCFFVRRRIGFNDRWKFASSNGAGLAQGQMRMLILSRCCKLSLNKGLNYNIGIFSYLAGECTHVHVWPGELVSSIQYSIEVCMRFHQDFGVG